MSHSLSLFRVCLSLSWFRLILCFDFIPIPIPVWCMCIYHTDIYVLRLYKIYIFFSSEIVCVSLVTRFARHISFHVLYFWSVLIENCTRQLSVAIENRTAFWLEHTFHFITNSNARCSMLKLIRVRFCNFVHNGKSFLCSFFFFSRIKSQVKQDAPNQFCASRKDQTERKGKRINAPSLRIFLILWFCSERIE